MGLARQRQRALPWTQDKAQDWLKAKIKLSLKKLQAWGATTHRHLLSWEFTIRSPCGVAFAH